MSSLIGLESIDCDSNCSQNCYEECGHTNSVIDKIGRTFYSRDPILEEYVSGILEQQELFLKELCEWQPDDCTRGFWLRYPCVQCIPESNYCTNSGAEPEVFDFASSQESINLYVLIINAITNSNALVTNANVKAVDNFVKLIWPGGEVCEFTNSIFHISLGRQPTALEAMIKNLIAKAMPLPLGTCIEFIDNCGQC